MCQKFGSLPPDPPRGGVPCNVLKFPGFSGFPVRWTGFGSAISGGILPEIRDFSRKFPDFSRISPDFSRISPDFSRKFPDFPGFSAPKWQKMVQICEMCQKSRILPPGPPRGPPGDTPGDPPGNFRGFRVFPVR